MRPRITATSLCLLAGSAFAAPQDVKLPENWRETSVKYREGDRAPPDDTRTGVARADRTAVGSAGAAHGSVIVFGIRKAKLDAEGKPVPDAEGRRLPDSLALLAVMAKQPGFGAGWPEDIGNGEWQYAA